MQQQLRLCVTQMAPPRDRLMLLWQHVELIHIVHSLMRRPLSHHNYSHQWLRPLPSAAINACLSRGTQGWTSSCSIAEHSCTEGLWTPCRYTLANIETRKGVRQGDKVFQVGFGGGALPSACHQ